jgi:hypothetical protein
MNVTTLEGELKNNSVACGRSDVTPTMTTRSANVDIAVKWRLRPRKLIEFAHGGFLLVFLRNPS